ncbi:MAG: 4-diphosphocytidyl-2C-methyl-D-erythritol kinase [Bacteroidota bacterium]|jgi:4-diphosphocytidyl-2-C-methyl-D-erythritol kinase
MPFLASSLVYDICPAMLFPSFSVITNSKINLGLHVLGRRADGFHNIESIFVAIDLGDSLTFEAADQLSVECHPAVTLSPEHNIVHKAARLYAERFPSDACGAKIIVNKRIPTGAGLGGGSGDAAATLLSLARINGRLDDPGVVDLLQPLAAECGSDVPFFLHSGVALVTGRGELVSPLDVPFPWTILLVCPGIHVNTANAYSTLGITSAKPSSNLEAKYSYAVENHVINSVDFINDFESAVFPQQPFLAEIKQRLINVGADFASMSGSGSSVYGLFDSATKAAEAAGNLADLQPYICAPVTAPLRII